MLTVGAFDEHASHRPSGRPHRSGCGRPPPFEVTVAVELLRLPLLFTAGDGAAVHAPMIHASVGGIDTLLVLDTGSEVHLLTKELSDVIGLQLVEGEEGTDHSGATMPSWSAGEVPMRAADLDLPLRDVVVIPAPGPFPTRGIGGILSPQHLHPDARVVLDMAADELLLLLPAGGEVDTFLRARQPAFTRLDLARDGRSSTPVVPGAIVPFGETRVLVNTGGRHTEFDVTAVPDLAPGAPERLGAGVSGAGVMGSVLADQVLAIGGTQLPVASLVVRQGMGYPPAMIGMDLLRGTVVSCDGDPGGRLTWQIPPSAA